MAVNKDSITKAFHAFNHQNILVIGDVMLDVYIQGEVNRISPEAPVPVLHVNHEEQRIGGAANVALNLRSLGAKPILCSIIGNDKDGGSFSALLKENDISGEGVIIDENRITTVKTRAISHNQQLLRIDREKNEYIEQDLADKLYRKISEIISQKQIAGIIFQDYDKGILTPSLIHMVIQLARSWQIPTFVDPKKRNFHHYRQVTVFKPNFKEFREGLGVMLENTETGSIIDVAQKYLNSSENKVLLLTLSEKGVIVADKHSGQHIPARIRDIADVSGAGDTVISTASLCYINHLSLWEMAYVSNIAGGLVCQKPGVVAVNKQELLDEVIQEG